MVFSGQAQGSFLSGPLPSKSSPQKVEFPISLFIVKNGVSSSHVTNPLPPVKAKEVPSIQTSTIQKIISTDGKDEALQILILFAELICVRVSGKQSSLNLSIFMLLFNSVESSIKLFFSRILGLNFQFSYHFNWVFCKVVFQLNSRVEFSSLILLNFSRVDFRLTLVEFLRKLFTCLNIYRLLKKWVTKPVCWLIFPTLTAWYLSSHWQLSSNCRQYGGRYLLVPYCLGLFFPFHTGQI